MRRELFACPHCGADVAIGSKVCRECGSDAGTGWRDSEEIDYQSLDLPEGYAVDPAHPGGPSVTRRRGWVVATAVVVAVALAAIALGALR